jgi:hypothetical protein
MVPPDPLSLRARRQVTSKEAQRILADESLAEDSLRSGVDLMKLVANLQLSVPQRIALDAEHPDNARFFRILEELGSRGIRFVLIGGVAGRIYGSSYATADFDICHARDAANLRALADLLRGLNAEYRRLPQYAPATIEAATFSTEADFVFTTNLGKLDLIGQFTGVGEYEDALAGAIPVELGGMTALVLSLPKLIASKRSTGRAKDTSVADELEIVSKVWELLMESAAGGH